MAFFTALINWLFNKTDAINQHNDHYEALEHLRRNHDWLDVKITQTEKIYQSLVLEIDPQHHELLIDELYPPEGVNKLQPGDTLEISSRSRRVTVNFYTRILARENVKGNVAFRVELPEEIGRNHNRQAYRVFVQNEEQLMLEALYHGERLDDVRIINLSPDGIKLSFAEDMCDQLKEDCFLKNCLIKLPSGFEVDCDIELRNIYRIRTPHPHSLAGGILTISLPQQRIKLEQYLASVQRRQRRTESRMA